MQSLTASTAHFLHRATLTPKEAAGNSGGSTSLCAHCQSKEGEIYARSLAAVNSLEQQFGECLLIHWA